MNFAYGFFCVNVNGIHEIEGGFTSKVEYRKSSIIMVKLSILQEAPKRRSPNALNIRSNEHKLIMGI